MELNEMISKLEALEKRIVAYHHAAGLISYDGQTTAPRGTGENRAETLGVLSEEIYKLNTGAETVELLDALNARADELDEVTKRVVAATSLKCAKFRRRNTSNSRSCTAFRRTYGTRRRKRAILRCSSRTLNAWWTR